MNFERILSLTVAPEPFTAATDCPHCGVVEVHWLAHPTFEATTKDDPLARARQKLAEIHAVVSVLTAGVPVAPFEPPGTIVARICRACGYRWAQR
jgi:hypothetical protein